MYDREKVIANLTRCQHGLCDECDLEHASHYVWDCEVQDQLINDALELLKRQEPQTVGGWVSVKDRLPEKKCACLIVINSGWRALDFWEGDGWAVSDENEITHWMPLPEPPEEVRKDG